MDIAEEFADEETREKLSYLAQEYEELFDEIRGYTRTDIGAWFVLQAWLDWKRIDRLQLDRKKKGDRPISGAQLKELTSLGMESLADLSGKEAQALIDGLTPKSPSVEEDEGGWY